MAKEIIFRGGLKLKGTVGSGTGDPVLTLDSTTKDVGQISPIDLTAYLSNTLASAKVLVGNASNVATAVDLSGAITINNTGVTTLANSIVSNANISNSAAIAYSKLNLASSIVNNDISNSAAIGRTKIATGNTYRILANNASGQLSENAALTGLYAVGADGNGQLTSLDTTNTQINYLSDLDGNLMAKLAGNIVAIPADSLVTAPSASEDGFAIMWDDSNGVWTLGDPVAQGIPTGGTENQALLKLSATPYDADWTSLLVEHITDIVGPTAADINILENAVANGLTETILSYTADLTSPAQAQINNKLGKSLSPGAIFYGNPSGDASQLAAGTNGYVLTMVGSYPQWQLVTGTGTVTDVDVDGATSGLVFTGGPVTASGVITLSSGTLDETFGGTGNASYTKGDILIASGASVLGKLGVGSNGQAIVADSAQALGVKWATVSSVVADGDYGDITVSSTGTVFTIDVDINKAWTGTQSWIDNKWSLKDNVDTTKVLAFQLSGISTGTTRTYTWSDFSGTVALLGATNGAALTKVDDTNITLTLGGTPTTSLLAATSITVGWSGQLAVSRGGLNLNTVSQGGILYGSALDTYSILAKDTNATRYLSNTGSSNNPAWAQIDLTNGVTGDLPFANLTQGSALSVLGVTGGSTADVASIVGTANQVLRVNSGGTALAFGQLNLTSSSAVTGALLAANGGTALDTSASTGVAQVSSGTWSVSTALANGTTATTQTAGDNTTKVATTAFVTTATSGSFWALTGTSTVTTPTITGKVTWNQAAESATNTFHRFTQALHTGGTPTGIRYDGGAHTGLANAETRDLDIRLGRTVTFGDGTTLAAQRAIFIERPTYAASTAKTITYASTLHIEGAPQVGSNITYTNGANYALSFGAGATPHTYVGGGSISGTATTDNFFNITNTMPTTMSATTQGIRFALTGAGSSNQVSIVNQVSYLAGYTGAGSTAAINANNQTAGTNTDAPSSTAFGNIAVRGISTATTTGRNYGIQGHAEGGVRNTGVIGLAQINKASGINIGVQGWGRNASATTPTHLGGYFGLHAESTAVTYTSAALMCDNGSETDSIFVARDNGTIVWSIDDGGVLTAADAKNIAFGTTTGTKIGTSTSQKIGFWNTAPIVQPANTVAIDDVLINTGLRASGGSANFTLKITNNLPQNLKNYTVATLQAGVRGDIAYVTDALAPTFLATIAGGGAIVTPVFYNGTNWVAY